MSRDNSTIHQNAMALPHQQHALHMLKTLYEQKRNAHRSGSHVIEAILADCVIDLETAIRLDAQDFTRNFPHHYELEEC